MRFYLGTHRPHWLGLVDVPLFVSRRTLAGRVGLPVAQGPWVLDSGGFTELSRPPHAWSITPAQYASEVERYRDGIGRLSWVAPMDWMCEPTIIAGTGLSVAQHQYRTIKSFVWLRERLGAIVAPVLQGWQLREYHAHFESYDRAGIDLLAEPVVGVGSICRRGQDDRIVQILDSLSGLRLHAFGVRAPALHRVADIVDSADSMAWSYNARRKPPIAGHTHKSCANCLDYALAWREQHIRPIEDRPRIGTAA